MTCQYKFGQNCTASKINQSSLGGVTISPGTQTAPCWQCLQQAVELWVQYLTQPKGNICFHYLTPYSLASLICIKSNIPLPRSCICRRHGLGGIGAVFYCGRPTLTPRPQATPGLSVTQDSPHDALSYSLVPLGSRMVGSKIIFWKCLCIRTLERR